MCKWLWDCALPGSRTELRRKVVLDVLAVKAQPKSMSEALFPLNYRLCYRNQELIPSLSASITIAGILSC
jgi:hypothetical protein